MKQLAWTVLGVAALAAVPTQAAEADYNFKLFGGVAYVTPLSDSTVEGDLVEASSEVGYEIGGEWKPFDRFGFEVSYLDVTHDVEVDGVKIGEIGLNPWNVTLNWHIINGKHFNWYVGPTVAFIDWGNLELTGGGSAEVDSETTFGISTGVDLALGSHFALFGGLRWLDASAESQGDSVSVDPLFARFGVAFRF
ncbi:MAG TPA: outer membrane beta-barrel protein [Candidatus Polarisedimenticolaceae bacterium]